MQYLLYGANGYTAQLIIKESLKQGLQPILAGRNSAKIEALGKEYELPYRIFDLDDPSNIEKQLQGINLCLNAAGPFSKTALPLAKACIATQTHYLDITGEVDVFEQVKALHSNAEKAGVMLMPGVGFDVIPSDCLANFLKEKMPDAQSLELAFTMVGGGISHGTASTMVSQLGERGLVRENGKLKKVGLAHKSKRINFGDFTRTMATIPWGDISTAYTSTQIPNIEVYTNMPKRVIQLMKFQGLFNPILRTGLVKKLGQKWVDKNLYGPNEQQNQKGKSYLYGKASNGSQSKSAILSCAEGYWLTALGSIHITKKVLQGDFKPGYQTPAMVYGWQLILELEGSEIKEITI
ncbi:MAG: membrane protein [Saprospiraceae bacterium]|nr:MAG: membrane protein [Saprospiraceae bacterium]